MDFDEKLLSQLKPTETCHTKVVGTTFRTIDWDALKRSPLVFALQREPLNAHDPNAIRVLAYSKELPNWIQVGYIAAPMAKELAKGLDAKQISIHINGYQITGGKNDKSHGINLELLICHLDLRHLLSLNPFRSIDYEG